MINYRYNNEILTHCVILATLCGLTYAHNMEYECLVDFFDANLVKIYQIVVSQVLHTDRRL